MDGAHDDRRNGIIIRPVGPNYAARVYPDVVIGIMNGLMEFVRGTSADKDPIYTVTLPNKIRLIIPENDMEFCRQVASVMQTESGPLNCFPSEPLVIFRARIAARLLVLFGGRSNYP